jgi:hypothetical protein
VAFGAAPLLASLRAAGDLEAAGGAVAVEAPSPPYGLPAFTRDGQAIGVVTRLEADGGGVDVVVPSARVRPRIDRARRRGEVVLAVRQARREAEPGSRLGKVLETGLIPAALAVSDETRDDWRRLARGEVEDVAEARRILGEVARAEPLVILPKHERRPQEYDPETSVPESQAEAGLQTESAVLAGSFWLARHQDADGRWSAAGFGERCGEGRCDGVDYRGSAARGPGAGDPRLDVAVTGLGLLALLGDGHTHKVSPHPALKRAVKRALQFLRRVQSADGRVGDADAFPLLDHAIATLALSEAYAVSGDFTLKRPAAGAVKWLLAQRHPELGGWGEPQRGPDTITTAWAVLALKSARVAALEVPDEAFAGARAWFDSVTLTRDGGPEARGSVGFLRPGDGGAALGRDGVAAALGREPALPASFRPVPNTTAAATLARVLCGEGRNSEPVQRGIALLAGALPRWGDPADGEPVGPDMLYTYFGTYANFQGTKLRSDAWKAWNDAMQDALLGDGTSRQGMVGCADGSWEPIGPWGPLFGRVGTTALSQMSLEIYYRYERASDDAGGR